MIFDNIKNSQPLEQILLNFIDVLRINILLVDTKGKPLLAPRTSGYGFYGTSQWGILQHLGTPEFLSKFQKEGPYLKAIDNFGFQSFAIPIDTVGYLIVGPVILNKQSEQSKYKMLAQEFGINFNDFLESLSEIRVLSFNSLKSILDLLSGLSQYARNNQTQLKHSIFTTLLDLSMTLSQAECGSIMLLNNLTNELSILAFKGIDLQKVQHIPMKLGDGLAGLAVQKRESFVINDEVSNNRISHLMKKPELKCSLVMPIIKNNNEVLGVMNISTKQGTSRLATHTQEMLKSLTEITSKTFSNFV